MRHPFYYILMSLTTSHMCSNFPHWISKDIHICGSIFWCPHARSILQSLAELLIDLYSRIRGGTWGQSMKTLPLVWCVLWSYFSFQLKVTLKVFIAYQVRRFPRAALQRTRHHSVSCKPYQKYFLAPSTSEVNVPGRYCNKLACIKLSLLEYYI